MNECETKVHHAIIDLYELYNFFNVDHMHVAAYLHTQRWDEIYRVMKRLQKQGILTLGENAWVITCDNCGYFPTRGEGQ